MEEISNQVPDSGLIVQSSRWMASFKMLYKGIFE